MIGLILLNGINYRLSNNVFKQWDAISTKEMRWGYIDMWLDFQNLH